jgi:4-hydroxybenzoate polyprenyltransferase
VLHAGGVCWTLVYDTIYAHQDELDYCKVVIKSTALLFRARMRPALAGLSATTIALVSATGAAVGSDPLFYVGAGLAGAQLARVLRRTDFDSRPSCWASFVGCGWSGFWIWLGATADYAYASTMAGGW